MGAEKASAPAPSRFTGRKVRYPSLYCRTFVCIIDPEKEAGCRSPMESTIGPVAFASHRLLEFQGSEKRLGSEASGLAATAAGAKGAGYGGGCDTPSRGLVNGAPVIHTSERSCTSHWLNERPYSCTSVMAPTNPPPEHALPPNVSLRVVPFGMGAHPGTTAAGMGIPLAYRSASSGGTHGAVQTPGPMLTTGCVHPCAPDVPCRPSNMLYPVPASALSEDLCTCTRDACALRHETHAVRSALNPSAKKGGVPSHALAASVSSQSVPFSEICVVSCASSCRTYVAMVMDGVVDTNWADAEVDPSNTSVATGTAGGGGSTWRVMVT